MSERDGMNYAPSGKPRPVVEPGAFVFAAAYLDHGHINGQCKGLNEAGATLKYVFDPQRERAEALAAQFPGAKVVDHFEQILDDPEVQLVAAAAIPCNRCSIGCQVLRAGKHYFTDKSPFTTLEQLAEARRTVNETGRKYAVYYSERLHVECAVHAGKLIEEGTIGRVLQVLNLAPHNLNKESRPEWFFEKEKVGGVLTDIGSHQFEQFLHYTGASGGNVLSARVENFANPDKPDLEDFGEANLQLDNGASAYCRIDWFNPGGSKAWGDGRCFILGTEGYIELRKYIDVARGKGQKLFLVDQKDTYEMDLAGKVGFPFFGELILDCLNGTEQAQPQEHAFLAAELSMRAQAIADSARESI
jgi:predicted dehydrogenase